MTLIESQHAQLSDTLSAVYIAEQAQARSILSALDSVTDGATGAADVENIATAVNAFQLCYLVWHATGSVCMLDVRKALYDCIARSRAELEAFRASLRRKNDRLRVPTISELVKLDRLQEQLAAIGR